LTVRVPLLVRIGVLVLATTGFYTYVGQMVPQKEVQPPEEIVIASDLTTPQMVAIGQQIMNGKGLCFTCHTLGKKEGPYRFPDLEGVDVRAKTREPGLSDVEYFAQAMYEPNAFIVPGFSPGMPTINKPPIGLTDQEILCVIAYLQTLGGTPTVTLQTKHHYNTGTATAPAQPGDASTPPPPAGAAGSGSTNPQGAAPK
jgi:mono/diheme cytochrome c family protein